MWPLITVLNNLNNKISKNFSKNNILTRRNASHGCYLCLYLPLCLPSALRLTLLPSINFFILPPSRLLFRSSLVNAVLVTPLACLVFGFNNAFSCLISLLFNILYPHCMVRLLRTCPGSFTLGEASVVVQAFLVFLYSTVANIWLNITNHGGLSDYETITLILQLGILFILLTVWTLHSLSPRITVGKFLFVVSFYITLLLITLHGLLRQSCIVWMLMFIFDNNRRLYLICFWAVVSVLGLVTVCGRIFSGVKASTSQRKVFHILSTVVYLTGYIFDVHLIYLASGIALGVLVALETVRHLRLGDFSVILNEGFNLFADEKDVGISLTPLYLLVGLSFPLSLCPTREHGPLLPYLAGVLSIGIGDTFASYIGSHYGKTRWSGTSKSVEGTLANLASQIVTISLLMYLGYIDFTTRATLTGALAAIVNSLEEAFTDQVDNLSLPLVTYFILQFA